MNAARFNMLLHRIREDQRQLEGGMAIDVPELLGVAERMRLSLTTIASTKPFQKESLMQYTERLRAIAAAAIES